MYSCPNLRENMESVDKLVAELRRRGVEVWLDRDRIPAGQRWSRVIRKAIEEAEFFIACFSEEYAERNRTYLNEELTTAVEVLRKRHVDRSWFIPIKFSECQIPDRDIGGGETLLDLQYVDLVPDWDAGVDRILAVIQPEHARSSNSSSEGAQGLPVAPERPASASIGEAPASADRPIEAVQPFKEGLDEKTVAEPVKEPADADADGARERERGEKETTAEATVSSGAKNSASSPEIEPDVSSAINANAEVTPTRSPPNEAPHASAPQADVTRPSSLAYAFITEVSGCMIHFVNWTNKDIGSVELHEEFITQQEHQ